MSKLLDPDWFGGTVTWQRVTSAREQLEAWPLPDWAVSLLTDRTFHTGAAKLIVLTELFIAAGLWWRGTRYAAVWVAVVFHVAIEVSAAVQVFSFLAIAVLVIWAVPSTRDRVLRIDPRWAPVARALDWLARFRVEPAPAAGGGGPRRRDAPRGAGARAGAQPPAADGVVRAPGAAAAVRPSGPSTMRPARPAARVWRAGATLALLLAVAFGVARAAGALPAGHRRASSEASAQATVDWFVRNQHAGRHLALPLRRRRRLGLAPSTTRSATPG